MESTTAPDDTVSSVYSNETMGNNSLLNVSEPISGGTAFCAAMYTLICVAGLVGNGMVIFVVLRYTKMKTVTNMYILNLAVADLCFLIGLPFLIVTSLLKSWVFGTFTCKLFYIATSINWFTSVFTLTVMGADRYLAVCHPIRSMRYRTPLISRIVCIVVWTVSLLVMLPIMLYATTVTNPENGKVSCTIIWPGDQIIPAELAFIWYGFLLGFAIPVALIIVFYTLVVIRLRTVGPKKKSKERKKSHRKVTKMVLTVIAVYVICWLPYWIFQVVLTFSAGMPSWAYRVFQVITMMSYANSMLNPLLYAFLSENFRKAFINMFQCAASAEVNGTLHAEHSVFPGGGRNRTCVTQTVASQTPEKRHANSLKEIPAEEEELEVITNNTEKTSCDNSTSTTKFIIAPNSHENSSSTPPATQV